MRFIFVLFENRSSEVALSLKSNSRSRARTGIF